MSLLSDGIELDALTSDPVSPADGRLWFNSAEGKLKIRVGGVTRVADVFGSEYAHSEDLPESTETGQIYVQQYRYATPSLPTGVYRVGWSLEFKSSNAIRAVAIRVQQDDLIDLFENDDVRNVAYQSYGSFHNLALSGVHTFDFDTRRVSAQAATASIKNIRLEIWRTS